MDLNDLTPKSDNIVVTLVHPVTQEKLTNEDGSDMTITLLNPHSKGYREIMYAKADERIEAARESGDKPIRAKDADMSSIDTLAKATVSWNITLGGECPKMTVSKAAETYDKLRWLKLQIEVALDTAEAFT